MPNEFYEVLSPGGMKLERRWVSALPGDSAVRVRGGSGRGAPGVGRAGRPLTEFSAKARRKMRWTWNALPWDEVADLTMITLTYPGDWRPVCPDGKALKGHLRALRERWRRKWGGPQGTWALEFQPRPDQPTDQQYAPHYHLYLGKPGEADFEHDRTDGRVVWEWARKAWWEVVDSGNWAHRYHGVHVRPCFYGRFGGGGTNGKRVGDYLWRESGKLAQKQAPAGFEGVKWWDVWGLRPVEHERRISEDEFVKMRRPARLLRDKVTRAKVRRPERLDGLTVTNIDGVGVGGRLLEWAGRELAEGSDRKRTDA
jgi:hypothetical protein